MAAPILFYLCFSTGCTPQPQQAANFVPVAEVDHLLNAQKLLTDIMVDDIFSPPVASRIYAYTNLAAYEALRPGWGSTYECLSIKLNGFTALPEFPADTSQIHFSMAGIRAFFSVARTMIHSPSRFDSLENSIYRYYQHAGLSEAIAEASLAWGDRVAANILQRAAKDNYKETRGMARHNTISGDAYWKPTPPAYMDAVEPHWNKILPFAMESAAQFAPAVPTLYSTDKSSRFYKDMYEVYELARSLTQEQKEIASFWDCNPYVAHFSGHMMFATKKITPGGHWMGIAGIAIRQSGADIIRASQIYTLTAIALADAFISCWDEKYRSNYIRPETAIQRLIDDKWIPLLQTPPFPEYTSGHSVISTAASVMLTQLLGENFAFTDSVEVEYGLPVRTFSSFRQAAEEAAVSRLYGGIHYRPAIENGVAQGQKLGEFLVGKIGPAIVENEWAQHRMSGKE